LAFVLLLLCIEVIPVFGIHYNHHLQGQWLRRRILPDM